MCASAYFCVSLSSLLGVPGTLGSLRRPLVAPAVLPRVNTFFSDLAEAAEAPPAAPRGVAEDAVAAGGVGGVATGVSATTGNAALDEDVDDEGATRFVAWLPRTSVLLSTGSAEYKSRVLPDACMSL